MLGQVMDTIQGQDVVIIVGSDHGGTPDGNHGRAEDEHLLVPIWFSGPGIRANNEIMASIRNRDMVPTLLWLMGFETTPYAVGSVLHDILVF